MEMARWARSSQLTPRNRWITLTANKPISHLLQRPCLFLAVLVALIALQSDFRRDITNQNLRHVFSATGSSPAAEILVVDGMRDGTTTLRSAKVRGLFQWGSRARGAARSSTSGSGKGKPEDSNSDSKLSPSRRGSEDSTKTSASGGSSTSSCGPRWSSKSSRSDDHDYGPDWDW
ncbi:hypothetical protein NP233_g5681 [Leucocoprinus birnbaumii]|uniref:Uncharacterized protein n=1 Tax=Leucocoprinus birnbaumii TaxID=56174 RepID=A0AAD5VV24_9AGAR|nr:hypothetical protein NP233_g5681 [Leucocoprinus birnbaumii]